MSREATTLYGRIKVRLDGLLAHRLPKPPDPLRFSAELAADAPIEGPALSLERVWVPGRLAPDHLDVSATESLLVTGPNGTGKSTLLAVLAGRLEPPEGAVFWRRGLRLGLLEQDVSFQDPFLSARETYAAALANGPMARHLVSWASSPRAIRGGRSATSAPASTAGSRWQSSSPVRRTSCSWTSPRTTSRSPSPRSWRRLWGPPPPPSWSPPTIASSGAAGQVPR